jgi:hypothetical protein
VFVSIVFCSCDLRAYSGLVDVRRCHGANNRTPWRCARF